MRSRESAGPERRAALHPELTPLERRRLILLGLDLFRRGEYYDCHEAWETVWRSSTPEPRDLWRGLIQISVGFYHFHHRQRPDVALRVLNKGSRRLAPFLPSTLGLDLASLMTCIEAWRPFLESAPSPGDEPPCRPVLPVLDTERLV